MDKLTLSSKTIAKMNEIKGTPLGIDMPKKLFRALIIKHTVVSGLSKSEVIEGWLRRKLIVITYWTDHTTNKRYINYEALKEGYANP